MKIINEYERDRIWSNADRAFDIAYDQHLPDANRICDNCIDIQSKLFKLQFSNMIAKGNTYIDEKTLPDIYRAVRSRLLEIAD